MNEINLKRDFYHLIENYSKSKELICRLSNKGEVLLFGGAVRGYLENEFKSMPRDFDIVINTNELDCDLEDCFINLEYKKNRYDGYKVKVDGLEFDIWGMKNTWAFKEQKLEMKEENLQETVFLNIDSIVYNLNKETLYYEKYKESLETRTLDVVLEDNPFIELNLLRALVFKKRYDMNISENLKCYFKRFISESRDNFISNLYDLQTSHYGKKHFSRIEIYDELDEIMHL